MSYVNQKSAETKFKKEDNDEQRYEKTDEVKRQQDDMRRLRGNRGISEHRSYAGAPDGTACLLHRGGGDAGERRHCDVGKMTGKTVRDQNSQRIGATQNCADG